MSRYKRFLVECCDDMTDRGSTDHWGLLASNLGLEVTPKQGERPPADETPAEQPQIEEEPVQPVPEPEPPFVEVKPARPPAPPKVRRTADDWARLANALGIVPPEEPAAPVTADTGTQVTGARGADAEAAHTAVPEPRVEMPAEVPAPSREEDYGEDEETSVGWTESVIELMEPGEASEAGALPQAPPDEPQRDRHRRKRRRRRSRRPDEAGAAQTVREETIPEEAGADLDLALPEEAAEEPGVAGPAADASAPPLAASGEARDPGRPRRRRRRRGGERRRERDDEPAGATPRDREPEGEGLRLEPLGAEPGPAAEPGAEEAVSDGAEDFEDEHEEGSDETSKADKEGHRAIPSWQEAISVIVDRNMEARARKPDAGGPPRSRGGRNRPGRGRRSD